MCGIFAYLNHLTPKTRAEVIDLLIKVGNYCLVHTIHLAFPNLSTHTDAGTETIGIPWI